MPFWLLLLAIACVFWHMSIIILTIVATILVWPVGLLAWALLMAAVHCNVLVDGSGMAYPCFFWVTAAVCWPLTKYCLTAQMHACED